jgi:hypothetical protein
MNITNGNTISMLYGSHPDGWIGKQIQVYAASVKAFGKVQDALRVRDFKPKMAVSLDEWKAKLEVCATVEELGEKWKSLPLAVKSDKAVIEFKDKMKSKLSK